MNVVHLTDSPFFGGPERQMLGLAVSLPRDITTTVLCFRDGLSSAAFIAKLGDAGVSARMLDHANPRFLAMIRDIADALRKERADLLVCHGYKADVLGWFAARRAGVPAVSVSRGWTGHTWKVRLNEALDRRMLRYMRRVVCVSEGQAAKVRRSGVSEKRVRVIHNAINAGRFQGDSAGRSALRALFPVPPESVIVAIGRLSPEKGFDHFIEAARLVASRHPTAGFVLLGDGPERVRLEECIRAAQLGDRFVLTGFRSDVDSLLQGADILAQSSHTEGLPNVVLEACAAGVAVVATDVGGTAEVIRNGVNGFLVAPGKPELLASRLIELIDAPVRRAEMGRLGRQIVAEEFSFTRQSAEYRALFQEVLHDVSATRAAQAPSRVTAGESAA